MSSPTPPNEPNPLPPEPPEVIAKREKLLADLDGEEKKAKGTFLQVVRTMRMLVANTAPSQPFDAKLYGDVRDSLTRFAKDPILPPPAILSQVVEYLQYRLATYGMTIQNKVMEMNPELGKKMQFTPPPLPGSAPAAGAPARSQQPQAKVKDGFESSGGSQRPMALNPEATPSAPPADPKAEQQQLESFKAWMKNPNLGKLKG